MRRSREVEQLDHPWVQEYFHGPRARAARATASAGTMRRDRRLTMETKANYVLIGAFTLVVTVLALLFALWAAKYSSERELAAIPGRSSASR